MFKLTIAFALVAAVYCAPPTIGQLDDSQYNFSYSVRDPLSGDSKDQFETRNGDEVQGEYSLIDADGFKRTVRYTASDANGFNAVVDRQPLKNEAPIPVSAAPTLFRSVPLTYFASPAVGSAAAPVAYRSLPLGYNLIGGSPITYSPVLPFAKLVTEGSL